VEPGSDMRAQLTLALSVAASALVLALGPSLRAQAKAPDPPLDQLLDRAGRHVEKLRTDLRVVIGDEYYTQTVVPNPRFVMDQVQRRTIESELLFAWFPDRNVWLAVRNVRSVDRQPIPDSKERLDRLLSGPGPVSLDQVRGLQEESTRFDIGSVKRTFGDPTIALRFLSADHRGRFAFADDRVERIQGIEVRKVTYRQTEGPAEIELNGTMVLPTGAFWVRPSDGAVLRTRFTLSSMSVDAIDIQVEFARDSKLGLWLPSRMEEKYSPRASAAVDCSARFSNYRRFETSGRIVR
jgi:hypothetical protein